MRARPELSVLLYNIRSAHNVGAIFRTAEAAGVQEIILLGYTPTPIDRFGRVQKDIQKAALGAETMVPWRHEDDIALVFSQCTRSGIEVVAIEQMPSAVPYTSYRLSRPTLILLGNEREGVPSEVCDCADATLHIPMAGRKESLNVSVAAGIVLFGLQ